MILSKKCDGCGVEGDDNLIDTDYNGSDFCRKCKIKNDLKDRAIKKGIRGDGVSMKVTGTDPRVFIGDKEIENITSFLLDRGTDFLKDSHPLSESETITFEGIYDPIDEMGILFKKMQEKGEDIITANIYNYDGEKREAKVRINYRDGEVTLEPVDEDIRKWLRGWIIKEATP